MHLPFIKETNKSNAYGFLFFFLTQKKKINTWDRIQRYFFVTQQSLFYFIVGVSVRTAWSRGLRVGFSYCCVFLYLWFQKTSSLIGHFMISVYTDIYNPNPPHLATGLLIYIVNNQVGLKIVFFLPKKGWKEVKTLPTFFLGKYNFVN